jgi:TetR/AcrR family transcriptional regulator, repressor for uid operon
MTKRVRMQPVKRRLLIIEAAEVSFAERGFHATTMHDIAMKSQISVGALYRYFASKDALITAIIQQSHQMALSDFTAESESKSIDATLSNIFGNLVNDPPTRKESALVAEVFAESFRNASVDKVLSANELEMEQWITQKLESAKKTGQLNSNCDPAAIALVLTALYDGLVLRASPGRSSHKEDIAKVISAVINAALSSK